MNRPSSLNDAVKAVIDRWDPYGLLAMGAPDNEWVSEVRAICEQLPDAPTAHDVVHLISRVFTESLGGRRFSPPDCEDVGRELHRALVAGSWIPRPDRE